MTGSRIRAGNTQIYRIRLEHPVMLGSKKVGGKKHNDGIRQVDTGTNCKKTFPRTKLELLELNKECGIRLQPKV